MLFYLKSNYIEFLAVKILIFEKKLLYQEPRTMKIPMNQENDNYIGTIQYVKNTNNNLSKPLQTN